jgi:hypothetical protein
MYVNVEQPSVVTQEASPFNGKIESMYSILISISAISLFTYMGWPVSLITTTIALSGFLSVLGLVITLYHNRNDDKLKLVIATSMVQLKKSFIEFASMLNSSVTVRELNNLRVITVHGEKPSMYYIPIKSSIEHEVYGVDSSGKRTTLTAASGTDYHVTPRELGYLEFIIKVQDNEFSIGENEKLTLKRIEELDDEVLNVD